MVEKLKINLLQFISIILSLLTIFTVNSCCTLIFGQEEEPKSLQRFKK